MINQSHVDPIQFHPRDLAYILNKKDHEIGKLLGSGKLLWIYNNKLPQAKVVSLHTLIRYLEKQKRKPAIIKRLKECIDSQALPEDLANHPLLAERAEA